MLDYDWGDQQSSVMLSAEDQQNQENDQNPHQFFHHHHDPFTPQTFTHDHQNHQSLMNPTHHFPTTTQNHQFFHNPNSMGTTLYDPRSYEPTYPPHTHTLPGLGGGGGFMVVPKSEPHYVGIDHHFGGSSNNNSSSSSRIGLNLGGRTYFSSSEDDFVNRLYRRTRAIEAGGGSVNTPRCQAEGCNADLTHAKHYHRRHKVCEFHSKAATVIAAGLTQRFCQQCSRFHLLSEFDNGKRSCRKRLADHNRRRRKSQQANVENPNKSQVENSTRNSSSDSLARSPPDSGAHSSTVTVAISPPRISLDCFRQRP